MFLSSTDHNGDVVEGLRGNKQQEVEGVHLSHMPSSNKEFYDKTPIEKNVHTRQEDEDYERKMREAVKFIPSNAFAGAKPGYEFRTGPNGLGYYLTTYKEEKGYSYELHFDEASQRPYVLLFELFKISVETHSKHRYWYNKMTGEVSWERPLERAQDVEIAKYLNACMSIFTKCTCTLNLPDFVEQQMTRTPNQQVPNKKLKLSS